MLKKTKVKMLRGGNIVQKEVTVYYLLGLIPIYKSVKEIDGQI